MSAALTRSPRKGLLRSSLIAIGALLLLWLSAAISIAGATRELRPDFALRLWPGDGLALAALADRILLSRPTDPAAAAQARSLAEAALAREPTSVRAARILATLSRSPETMEARFAYARRLSRRDLLTNLWFIEAAVQHDDVPGALAQYDVALRTSSRAPQVLFPILNPALAQRHLQTPIASLLATGSADWVPDFVDFALAEGSQIGNLGRVIVRQPEILARLQPARQARLIALLADQRQFDVGARLYRALSGTDAAGGGDLGLTIGGEWPPFDWLTASSGDHGVSQTADGLRAFSQNGSRASVTRRLVRLPAGDYALRSTSTLVSAEGTGGVVWSVACARGQSAPLAILPIGDRPGSRQTRSASLRVPAGCDWQWLTLEVSSALDGPRFEIDISSVRIDPAR
jgi:hypothetical protein